MDKMTMHARPVAGATYLIALRHAVVAQDIAMTVAEFDGGAAVLVTAPEGALAALEGVARVAVAFVAADPDRFARSPLGAAVAARGGRAVLMGEAAEADPQGFAVLQRPFATEDVLEHLRAGTPA